MYWGSSATSVLVGVVGGVLVVCAVVLSRRLGGRRAVGTAGLGLLLLGLSLSGLVEVVARALALFSFNPLRWAGVGAVVVGALMLSWSGMIPGRGRRSKAAGHPEAAEAKHPPQAGSAASDRAASDRAAGDRAGGDADLDEIEEILRRRGIS
ncbi:MAG TPA: hypothetical protein VFJ14_16340 [Nocardioidaceae bacterium]|nr:hypothetical protein [Nocardioidaceae bacterium]